MRFISLKNRPKQNKKNKNTREKAEVDMFTLQIEVPCGDVHLFPSMTVRNTIPNELLEITMCEFAVLLFV